MFIIAKITLLRQKTKLRRVLQDNASTKLDCPLMQAGSGALEGNPNLEFLKYSPNFAWQ
jgi:hypothetical protein